MKKERSRKTALTAVFAAMCLIAIFFSSCTLKKYGGPADSAPVSAAVAEEVVALRYINGDDETELFSENVIAPSFYCGGEGELFLSGEASGPVTVIVLHGDNVILERELLPGGRASLDGAPEGELKLSFITEADGKTAVCTSSEAVFAKAASGGYGECAVLMTGDIVTGADVTVSSPFTWETGGHTFKTEGELRFVSSESGTMTILNGDGGIACGRVFCDAVLWDFVISEPFGGFLEQRPYYIYARSVNGREIDCGELYISSAEAFSEAAGGRGIMPYVKRVVFEGDFTLPGVEIPRPLSLSFLGNVGIEGGLTIRADGECSVKVDTSGNGVPLSESLRFEIAEGTLSWNGEDAPAREYVERYMNVKSYNGTLTDPHIGGVGGVRIVSGRAEDSVTGQTADFVPDGNVIELGGGYANGVCPENAVITAALDGAGSYRLEKHDGKFYCIVTDVAGNERGYRIEFYRQGYKLPVIYINTEDGKAITSKEKYVPASFSINYNGALNEKDIEDAAIGIRGRGNSSWKLDKKPYKIKFEKKTSLFGLQKAKKWVLIANHVDKSLIRNRLAYSIGDLLDALVFVPGAELVDVFVNGAYQGVYQCSEEVEINEGRVPGEEGSTEVDTDYLLEIGSDGKTTPFGKNAFTHELFRYVEIKDPDSDIITKEQFEFVKEYVKSVEDAIMEGGDYASLLDVPSLVDWFLLYEFSYNLDGIFRRSDFLCKEKGGKLYFAVPWDFDYAFGNMSLDSSKYHEWICLGNSNTDDYDNYIPTNIMDYLLDDEYFISCLKERWAEVGAAMLERGLAVVDEAEENAAPSANENFMRWDILGKKVQFEKRAAYKIKTYSGQLAYLRDFMNNRFEWMDKTIRAM